MLCRLAMAFAITPVLILLPCFSERHRTLEKILKSLLALLLVYVLLQIPSVPRDDLPCPLYTVDDAKTLLGGINPDARDLALGIIPAAVFSAISLLSVMMIRGVVRRIIRRKPAARGTITSATGANDSVVAQNSGSSISVRMANTLAIVFCITTTGLICATGNTPLASIKLPPLHNAALWGDMHAAEQLLRNGADINGKMSDGSTPLWVALFAQQHEMARLLVNHGADCNDPADLRYIARIGDVEMVTLLLAHGADAQGTRDCGQSLLHTACAVGNEELVRLALSLHLNVNARNDSGETPLYRAARSGNETIVRMLLDAGADRNIQTMSGLTPFQIARQHGRTSVLGMLGQ